MLLSASANPRTTPFLDFPSLRHPLAGASFQTCFEPKRTRIQPGHERQERKTKRQAQPNSKAHEDPTYKNHRLKQPNPPNNQSLHKRHTTKHQKTDLGGGRPNVRVFSTQHLTVLIDNVSRGDQDRKNLPRRGEVRFSRVFNPKPQVNPP
jgi:hypothetical protein